MRMNDITLQNRPRERLIKEGVSNLSDQDLLAVILQKGTKGENVIDMCNKLIAKYDITDLPDCTINELQKIKGIGKAKACQLIAAFELNHRIQSSRARNRKIECPDDVYRHISPKISHLKKECFMILHLDSKNRVLKDELISVGTLNKSIIHPREVFRSAIKQNSNSLIIAHNHPSGDPEPSDDDKEITSRLMEAGRIVDIQILDHIIIGKENYYSFEQNVL